MIDFIVMHPVISFFYILGVFSFCKFLSNAVKVINTFCKVYRLIDKAQKDKVLWKFTTHKYKDNNWKNPGTSKWTC